MDSKDKASNYYNKKEERTIVKKLQALTNSTINGVNNKKVYQEINSHFTSKKVRSTRFKADLHLILTAYFNKRSEIDSSIYHAKRVLALKDFENDTLRSNIYGLAYHWLGSINGSIGLNSKAKKWYLKGIEISQKYDDKRIYYVNAFGLANRITNSSNKLEELDTALDLYKKCSEYKEHKEMVFGCLVNIANIYGYRENYLESINYLEQALEICRKNNRKSCIGTISFNLAVNYKKIDKLNQALTFVSESIEIAENNGFQRMEVMAKLEKGRILSLLAKYEEGEKLIFEALEKAKALNLLENQKTIYYRLREIAILQNDYKKALNYSDQYTEILDSIRTLDKDKEVNELEVKYKTLQKEREIKILKVENTNRELKLKNQEEAIKNLKLEKEIEKKENENQILAFQNVSEKRVNEISLLKKDQELQELNLARQKTIKNIILYSFLIILIPIIGLLAIYYQKLQTQSKLNVKEKEVNQQKITSLLKDQELEVIKASVEGQDKERKRIAQELHDSIGGNLAAIKLQLNSPEIKDKHLIGTINHQIDETYQQVRNLSHNLIPKRFGKNKFCDVLEEYLDKIGSSSSITPHFSLHPRKEIDLLNEELQIEIFMIIQELITNTIKHAEASSIELHINMAKEDTVNIIFEDNGVGFDIQKIAEGLGFVNIKSRLEKVYGSLIIDSRKGRGTIINIEINNLKPTTYEI
ncbi:tetratricopeptide repeat-containing sensor histidine kinase [Aquimarina spongiae]|uniref:histidine kinase n=1 Tax=Aquimarina spongiae TaxID=570521 RepID=A0A1M6LGC9_9FLAO|nr:tetratricopeptide repeat-containing sensor histidine kinase [Aquimarina spongiae]SHJ70242.1 Signal transduction histidine kinase [Aquimarina spongiae]